MHLFYTPDVDASHPMYFLSEEESKHCVRVLRLQAGDEVQLIDGRGGLYQAVIHEAHPKRTILKITSVQSGFGKRNHHLHIAIAPTKNIERFEWFLEKATEIGIDEITPIICQRSERKEVKTDRSAKIITSAIKQSLKAYHPILNPPIPFSKFIRQQFDAQKFIAHCIADSKTSLSAEVEKQGSYVILIGPEGDFTPAEVDLALQTEFKAITLGDSRLRTETAALAACFEINFLNR
ncbi:16S rRNA (uracil(1498)-N(3))-methyltransferase [Mucilaginibacter calamicampi]|uniref:Ribosomal RNA small subunit methyltransferase E n=1 Tax=Mucilaginibacter calamicampi TaxID=1302352 RepID=A0ABW2Z4U4_9SPHI